MSSTSAAPWPIALAQACFDGDGRIAQWPRQGDYFSQIPWELDMMRLAWYVQAVYSKRIAWERADPDFLWWLNSDEDDPHDLFIPRLHLLGDVGVGQLEG